MSTTGQWVRWAAGVFLLAIVAAWLMRTGDDPAREGPLAAGTNVFGNLSVRRFHLEFTPAALDSLRQNPRRDVPAVVREGTNVFREVSVHLKGAKGSFRPVDDKPGMTLGFPAPGFYGHPKIHLNNAIEDPTFLHERLGSELFQAAGIPAARTAYALTTFNGRTLGLFVLKEGFTEDFTWRHFGAGPGNFYEPEDGQDIGGTFERKFGAAPNAQAGLADLAAAMAEPDLANRWERLGQCLDREEFASFMALEVMLGHRDGYSLARNNYRLFYDADKGRMHFIPHGMDVLFGKADLTWRPHMSGLVAKSFMEIPEGRQLYRRQFERHFTNLLARADLILKVVAWSEALAAQLPRAEARALRTEAANLCLRLAQRRDDLRRQLAQPELAPLVFTNNVAGLRTGWSAVDAPPGGALKLATAPDGKAALHIRAGPRTAASWRQSVRLDPGEYHFEGGIFLRGVQPLDFGRNRGAGLGVEGVAAPPYDLLTTTGWQRKTVTFAVAPPGRLVELRCELFASDGEAWFDLESLRLVRVKANTKSGKAG